MISLLHIDLQIGDQIHVKKNRVLALAATSLLITGLVAPTGAQAQPKLGPNAIPITVDHAFLESNPAPDYWAYAAFTRPQFTSSACGVASVTAALDGLNGLPKKANEKIPSQQKVLKTVGDKHWSEISAEGGDGVKFSELVKYSRMTMKAMGPKGASVSAYKPASKDAATGAKVRELLAANELTADNVLLVYFNQGVLTGDWNGPHVSPIGAYDAATDRVLILDVDQEWYIPYWSPVDALIDAMLKPAPKNQGVLAGQTGGMVSLSR